MSVQTQIFVYFCLFTSLIINILVLVIASVEKHKILITKHEESALIDLDVQKFNSYLTRFNKTYSVYEYQVRLQHFKESLAEIAKLNVKERGTVFGLTEFSDMSAEEFADRMLRKPEQSCREKEDTECERNYSYDSTPASYHGTDLNDTIDWRKKGVIGPIQNQKLCNGCWAFSTAGVIESIAKIKGLTRENLSIQEVLDCCVDGPQHDGCSGGNIFSTLLLLCYENRGIVTEEEYPLTLKREGCSSKISDGIKIKRYAYLCNLADDQIKTALMNGPVTAVVNAATWRNYVGGIIKYSCPSFTKYRVHDVQIVGYDATGSIPYYIVRNSWGELFGEHGYVRVAMGDNVCGIANEIGIVYDVYS